MEAKRRGKTERKAKKRRRKSKERM